MLRLVSYSIFQSLLAARSPVNYILNLCVFNIIATIIVPVAYAPLFTSTFHDVQKGFNPHHSSTQILSEYLPVSFHDPQSIDAASADIVMHSKVRMSIDAKIYFSCLLLFPRTSCAVRILLFVVSLFIRMLLCVQAE